MTEEWQDWLQQYIWDQIYLIEDIDVEDVEQVLALCEERIRTGGTIFICGNGGSLLNAQHFAEDVNKGVFLANGRKPHVYPLGTNPGMLTAIGNDLSYADIFEFEMQTQCRSSNDLLIGISVSGNSPNVVNAMKWAKAEGVETVAITGNGGNNAIGKLADYVVALHTPHFGRAEDAQMVVLHMIAYGLMEMK